MNTDGGRLNIPVEVDVTSAANGIGRLTKDIEGLGKSAVSNSSKIDRLTAEAARLSKVVAGYQQQFSKGGLKGDSYDKAITATRQFIGVQQRLRDELIKASQSFDGKGVNTYRESMFEVNRIIKDAKASLDALTESQNSNSTSSTKQTQATNNAMMEMRKLKLQLIDLQAAGKGNSQEAQVLIEKIGALGTAMREVNTAFNAATTGATQISGLMTGLQGLMGAFTAGSGVLSMFVEDQEKLMKVQTKLQASMSILMGMAQVSNTLHATSAFRVTTVTTATKLWNTWNLKTATSLVKLGASANAARIAVTALHGALLAIGGAAIIAVIAAVSNQLKKQRDEAKKAAEEQKEAQEKLLETEHKMSAGVGEALAKFSLLQKEWSKLSDNDARNKWIKDNESAFNALGLSIQNVNDASSAFVTDTSKVIAALKTRAEAAALQSLYEDEYKKYIQKSMESVQYAKRGVAYGSARDRSYADFKKSDDFIGAELSDAYVTFTNDTWTLSKAGIDKINEYREKKAKEAHDTEVNLMKEEADRYGELYTQKTEEAENNAKALGNLRYDGSGNGSSPKSGKTYEEEMAEVRKKLAEEEFDETKRLIEQEKALVDVQTEHDINALNEELEAKKKNFRQKGWNTDELEQVYDALVRIRKAEGESEKKAIDKKRETEEEKKSLKAQEDLLNYEVKYAEAYEDRVKAIKELYRLKINNAENEGQRLTYQKEEEEALKNLAESVEGLKNKYGELYAVMFANAEDLTRENLAKAIEAVSEAIKDPSLSTEELARLTRQLNDLKKAMGTSDSWGFGNLVKGFSNYKSEDPQERAVALNQIRTGAQQVSQMFSQLARSLESFRTGLGDWGDTLADIGGVLDGLASNTENIVTAFTSQDKGSIIAAGISSAVQLVSMITTQIARNKKAQEEWNQTIKDCAHEYSMLKIEALDYKESNIFGVENPYQKAIDGAKQYTAAMGELRNVQDGLGRGQVQTGTKKVVNGANVGIGLSAGAGVGAAIGSVIPVIGTAIGAAIGAVVGGIAGLLAFKTVPVFDSLTRQYGELWDENYQLNKQMLADYKKLDDATKKLIDNWDDIVAKAKEAEQQMKENFSELAGDIGDQLSESLVNAFRSGDIYAAMGDFKAKMTTTLESIMEKLVFDQVFSSLFNELEDNMMKSFGANGDGDITDDLINFTNSYGDRLEEYTEAMRQVQEAMDKQGYSLWDSQRSASAAGIANASQESVDELNGRATAIQGHTYQMNENLKIVTATCSEILVQVMGIHTDTTSIESRMQVVERGINHLSSNVETMITKGIRVMN